MKTDRFNLIDEDWIPVLMVDGTCRRASLHDIFSKGSGIADLSMVAYERISVMRLLICIAMAALDVDDLKDEEAWLTAREKVSPAVLDYFEKWHDRFNFYGEHAFMQPDDLSSEPNACLAKLFPHRASGNNGTLFDHAAVSANKNIPVEDVPIGMLTYLNYSAGGRHAKCMWTGVSTEATVTAGPCREKSMLQTYLVGGTVLDTVWSNLITGKMMTLLPSTALGRPFWEFDSLDRGKLQKESISHALCGRLVPLSRVMKFLPDRDEFVMGEGLKYAPLPESRDPMGAVIARYDAKSKSEVDTYVSASVEEMPWRNLWGILSMEEKHGTITLRHISTLAERDPDSVVSIWCGGLVGDQAKDVAVVEWRTSLQAGLIGEGELQVYKSGIESSKLASDKLLYGAAKVYCLEMKIDGVGVVLQPARRFFWESLEKEQHRLQALAFEGRGTMDDWKALTLSVAREAFRRACPHATGRQLEAYVRGCGMLNFKKEN